MNQKTGNVSRIRKDLDDLEMLDPNERSALPRSREDIARASSIARDAVLTVERNRWFIMSMVLLVCVCILVMKVASLSNQIANNFQLAYVKMYPSGQWDVELSQTQDTPSYLRATVDGILANWVSRRFGEKQEMIRADYGYVLQFLSPRLKTQFTSTEGFNAAQRAADIQANRQHGELRYEVGAIDHFDQDSNAVFGGVPGVAYRTNVMATRKDYNVAGNLRSDPDQRFVRIEWRLMERREVDAIVKQDGGMEWLRENPIGLEIISFEEFDDISDNE